METKQQQFLMIVQTMFIANAINLKEDDVEGKNRHIYSATGAYMLMDEAISASLKIPENMSASEAAHDFGFFMISNLREEKMTCPNWFARY